MKLGIMQPYFFPYLGYFQLISAVDKFILYGNVSFRKKSWITRNFILPNNGMKQEVFVPVLSKSSYKNIAEVQIEKGTWKKRFLNQVFYAYKKAEFFHEIYYLLEKNLNTGYEDIHHLNSSGIIEISKFLDISTAITFDTEPFREIEDELDSLYARTRDGFPADEGTEKKVCRIHMICKKELADSYYNAIGGYTLYRKEDFYKKGIDLRFIQPGEVSYKQFQKNFTPDLSIIDVLMHCGKSGTKERLGNYNII